MTIAQRWDALSALWKATFRDHEIFVRTGGEVRFLRLSATLQRRVVGAIIAALSLWLIFTIAMLAWQAHASWKTRDVASRAVAVEAAEARVSAESNRIEQSTATLRSRQDYLESVVQDHLGATINPPPAPAAQPAAAPVAEADKLSELRAIGARQNRLVAAMTNAILQRSARAEAALRTVGIRAGSTANQGGPFIAAAAPGIRSAVRPPREPGFLRLAAAIDRMEVLEQLVLSIPSTIPAEGMNLSSGFGYRHDPFTGAGAMHAGLDFKGAHGSPIHAAAAGIVSYVGGMSGYGNVVQVDHGHGIMTRYAHLSGFNARVGDHVIPGQQIARMGSTGRSTGTHLHFEVRVNGTAVNPRRFLEATSDVLEIKADAGQRLHAGAR